MNPALLRTLATRQAYSNRKSPAAKADSYDFLMDNPRGRVSRPLPFPGYICRRAFLRKQQNPSSPDLRCHCQPGLLGRPLPFHVCRIPCTSISFPYRSPTDLLFIACLHGYPSDSRSSDQILSVPSRWLFQKFHVPCPAFPVFSLRLRRSLQGGCRRLQKPFCTGIRLPCPRDVLRWCCGRLRCSPPESKSCRRSFLFPPIRIYSNTRRLPAWKPPCTKNSFYC